MSAGLLLASVLAGQALAKRPNASSKLARNPGNPPHAKDFALRRDSPAWKLGFQPIPLDRIGLYQDDLRAGLPGTKPGH